jgi:hypothetical protein
LTAAPRAANGKHSSIGESSVLDSQSVRVNWVPSAQYEDAY